MKSRGWMWATVAAVCLTLPAGDSVAQAEDIDALKRDLERMQERIEELEARDRAMERGDPQELLQLEAEDDAAAGVADESDEERDAGAIAEEDAEKPEPEFEFGGAIWINYADQSWVGEKQGKRGLRFDNLRLSLDGSYDKFLMSAQYRFYSFTRALHHAWIGYDFAKSHCSEVAEDECLELAQENRLEVGVTQVPFGILPFASHNFWFMIPYYVGLEDDYDAGLKWTYGFGGDWTLDAAFFLNEEYGDATDLDRYSVDVVRDGDQQNEERNQLNLRLAYDLKHGKRSHTELGISGRYGDLDNRTTNKRGDYWAAAVHANAFIGPWNLMLEGMRYAYNPENPEGVSDDLVLMGNLASKRLIAAEADIVVANIAYDFGAMGGPVDRLNCYNNYSYMDKAEDSFEDSQLNDLGCLVTMGPFWIWTDIITGKNAWYLNDSEEDSGFGPGGSGEWETRFNVSLQWYF